MKRWKISLLAITVVCFGNAQVVLGAGLPGNKLKEICYSISEKNPNNKDAAVLLDSVCTYYVMGTVTGLQLGMVLGAGNTKAPEHIGGLCLPESSTGEQWKSIVIKWLKEHPEKLHNTATLLILLAMKEAFPC